ncbi:leucine-rich repeat domain-containing protein [Pseudobacteriovorax antillogorgiicola]|uniref:Leucine Rich repeat-containing protein n=1 Tax=Pseudobacteriovorax antillogorgiicola TaxID=1513793 RepID=A0A1Y6BYM9_9BACT|nr:leucine-rich repeat domain-containing protein [Pseudobacteriovorax antillogorgiicola]TCS50350.1 hypothetical protein EDD56_113169 [Pseudobacteriovorax antillogorgiicola]SMF34844.1 hypothetical protein SAMN06296036_110168 [Pseudobacteriovorax antillogorgiicola]
MLSLSKHRGTILKASALASMLTACNGQLPEQSRAKNSIPPTAGSALLETGYDTHTEEFRGSCVAANGPLKYAGSQRSEIRFDRSMTLDELKTALEVQISGKLKIPSFDVSGAAKFISDASSTDLSDSMIFSYQVKGKSVIMQRVRLSQEGLAVKGRSEADVRKTCGDEYVSEVQLGAQLFVLVNFEFANREAKSSFEAQIDVNLVDLFSLSGAASTSLDKFKDSISISMSALQIGGNPSRLATILQSNGSSGIPIVNCSITNKEQCLAAMQKIVKYASGEGRGDFIDQIQNLSYNPTDPNGAAFIGYKSKSYYESALYDLYPVEGAVIQRAVADNRASLVTMYEDQAKANKRANALLRMRLSQQERNDIRNIASLTKANLRGITDTAKICYEKPGNCVGAFNKLVVKDFDQRKLQKKFTFFDYCDLPNQSSSVSDTIEAIRVAYDARNASCGDLESDLLNSLELDLSDSDPAVRSLKPLQGLEHLQYLDISKNQVRNISLLSQFKSLRFLNARENSISNIIPVSNLNKLTYLDLAYNRVIDAEPLRNNRTLKTLLIHGNDLFSESPLLDLQGVDTLIISEERTCEEERKYALSKGWVSQSDYELFKTMDFAPNYYNPGDRSSGLDGWLLCPIVFSSFDPGA